MAPNNSGTSEVKVNVTALHAFTVKDVVVMFIEVPFVVLQ
jgi:hypothetical protein